MIQPSDNILLSRNVSLRFLQVTMYFRIAIFEVGIYETLACAVSRYMNP